MGADDGTQRIGSNAATQPRHPPGGRGAPALRSNGHARSAGRRGLGQNIQGRGHNNLRPAPFNH